MRVVELAWSACWLRHTTHLATCHFVVRKEPVLICGPTGVGKSHLAQALGHAACRRGYDVVYINAARLLQHLAGGRADGTYERRLQSYLRPDLLIIDDFGLKPLRPPAPEDFYDVINERYEKGATLVTSNRALEEWPQLFDDPLLASAGLDRLFHNAHALRPLVLRGGRNTPIQHPCNSNSDPSEIQF